MKFSIGMTETLNLLKKKKLNNSQISLKRYLRVLLKICFFYSVYFNYCISFYILLLLYIYFKNEIYPFVFMLFLYNEIYFIVYINLYFILIYL